MNIRIVLCLLALFCGGCSSRNYLLLEQAEEFSRQQQYDQAIEAYQAHIAWRLALADRPEWENPYFYLLLIGDLHIAQERYQDALASFELAEKNRVDKMLVSDRYRYIATILERQGKFQEAVDVLRKYHDRDPLLYDIILDRIGKELVLREDSSPPSK